MTTQSNTPGLDPSLLDGHSRRKLETREALLKGGRQLLLEIGPAVTIDKITLSAGVAKGSFYNHFSSREELFGEILEAVVMDIMEKYSAFNPAISDPLELLSARAQFAFRTLLEDPDACRLLLLAEPAAVGSAVDRGLHATLFGEIKAGVEVGALRQTEPSLLYAAYFGVVTATIGYLISNEPRLSPEEGALLVTQLIFAVLGLPEPRTQA
jgi:AcrR family transcriptional regulator